MRSSAFPKFTSDSLLQSSATVQNGGGEGRGFHSTFTHLKGGLNAKFWKLKLLIYLHLELPP